jgi:long-chain acyl-CoA synthetase
MDELKCLPYPGIDTLYKAFYRRVEMFGDDPMMGVRVDKEYKWISFKEVAVIAKHLAAGLIGLNLVSEVEESGKMWRFLGLKSKNRKEWGMLHTANWHCGVTSIALYDTLGADATNYIMNQTQMSTIATSKDLIKGILK